MNSNLVRRYKSGSSYADPVSLILAANKGMERTRVEPDGHLVDLDFLLFLPLRLLALDKGDN
jgi:hypothetical protein